MLRRTCRRRAKEHFSARCDGAQIACGLARERADDDMTASVLLRRASAIVSCSPSRAAESSR